ncbi:MAG: type II toxin-antitoxin system MqsA family antitoxin [Coriobacteriia bacterium]|nr:type II toxin-antitoxin system MqsA family antitoxin [Coriobacteriia bacterium]
MAQQEQLTRCPVCGGIGIELTDRPLDLSPEGEEPTMVSPGFMYRHCTLCGEDILPGSRCDELDRMAVAIEQERDGLLAAAEIREARLALGVTQADLGRLLGVTSAAVGRWESGLVRQNRTADTLLRLLAAHPELVAETGFIAAEGRGPYGRKAGEE